MAYNEHSLKREHRKQWYSIAKRVDKSCRNHGSCPWCQGNRTHKERVQKIKINDLLKENNYEVPNNQTKTPL